MESFLHFFVCFFFFVFFLSEDCHLTNSNYLILLMKLKS